MVLVAGLLSGCGAGDTLLDRSAGQSPAEVVVGSGDTAASRVLAEIYAGSLRSTGVAVTTDTGLGDRSDYLEQLDAGVVTVVPEFTGRLLRYYDPGSRAKEQDEVFDSLSKALPQGLSISDFATAEDLSAVAVSEQDARRLNLETLDQLVPFCAAASATFAPEFEVDALSDLPECTFARTSTVTDGAAAVRALAGPSVQDGIRVAGVTTASPDIADAQLVLLADDEHVFPAQNVVPLYRTGSLGESQITALNMVAGELTTADLAEMSGRIRGGADPTEVARTWLDAHF